METRKRRKVRVGALVLVVLLCIGVVGGGYFIVKNLFLGNKIDETLTYVNKENKRALERIEDVQKRNENTELIVRYPNFGIEPLDQAILEVIDPALAISDESIALVMSDYSSEVVFDQYINVHLTLEQYAAIENKFPTDLIESQEYYFAFDKKNNRFMKMEDCVRRSSIDYLNVQYGTTIEDIKVLAVNENDLTLAVADQKIVFDYLGNKGNMRMDNENIPNGLLFPKVETTKRVLDDRPMICFTFDDGPSIGETPVLMDIFDQYNGKATFFELGSRMAEYTDITRDVVARGFQVGNHSYSHADLSRLPESELLLEVNSTNDYFYSITGQEIDLIRPTFGAISELMETTLTQPMINWTIDTLDWQSRNADSVVAEVLPYVQDGSIILMHDLYPSTTEAVRRLLPELANQGYQFVTLNELFERNGGYE